MYKRIMFKGLGGAGQRHLRLLRKLLPESSMFASRHTGLTPVLSSDFTVRSEATLESEYGIHIYDTIDEAYNQDPDLIVIATPSSNHAESIIQAAERKVNILVEKPGAVSVQQAESIISTVRRNKVDFFISYQRRFHPLVVKLRSLINTKTIGELMSVKVAVSSYVPNWHPYEDFHKLYACNANLGGGVLRTESHELDLVTWLFGLPEKIFSAGGCRGVFDIDVEDSAELLLDYKTFSVQISLCFMQLPQERRLIFFGQEGSIELDLIVQKLTVTNYDKNKTKVYEDCMDNEMIFQCQTNYFLNEFVSGDEQYLEALRKNSILIEESLRGIG